MKTKRCWILVVLVICFGIFLSTKILGISASEKTQLEKFGVSTLKGIEVICPIVLIVILGEDQVPADRIGSVTRTEIETQVELSLRKAGIRVGRGSALFIYIEANECPIKIPTSDAGPQTIYAYTISTELHQPVNLIRDPKIRTEVKTWPVEPFVVGRGVRFATSEMLGKLVKEDVDKQMKVFCNDYLAANPKDE